MSLSGSLASFVIAVLSICCQLTVVVHAAPAALQQSKKSVVAPFIQCGPSVCDLRTHYCDEQIDMCARCDDDCHPARINGDRTATEECHQKCQWYYVFTTTPATTTTATTSSFLVPSGFARLAASGVDDHQQGSEYGAVIVVLIVVFMSVPLIMALTIIIILLVVFCRKNPGGLMGTQNCNVVLDKSSHARPQDDTRLVSSLGELSPVPDGAFRTVTTTATAPGWSADPAATAATDVKSFASQSCRSQGDTTPASCSEQNSAPPTATSSFDNDSSMSPLLSGHQPRS